MSAHESGRVYGIDILPRENRSNGFVKYGLDQPVPFDIEDQVILSLPPSVTIGNHRHARSEALFAINDGANFCWLNEREELEVTPITSTRLIVVEAWVPHAIQNIGSATVHLVEYGNMLQANDPAEKLRVV